MKKIGDYALSDAIISITKTSRVIKAANSKGQIFAVKEIKTTDFVSHKVSKNSEIIRALLTNECRFIVKLIDFFEDKTTVYLVEELAKSTLAKELKTNELQTIGERKALLIFTQIMSGYKYLFKKGLIYKNLSINNVLKIDSEFKLSIPTTIIEDVPETLDKETFINQDFLYFSPEQLISEDKNLTPKTDIWSMGCILYKMIFGIEPWKDFDFPKKYFSSKELRKSQKCLYFCYYHFIKTVGLRFPQPNNVNPIVIDLLKQMLTLNIEHRISFDDMLKHKVLDFFYTLSKSNQSGEIINTTKSKIPESNYKCPDIRKLIDENENSQVKDELKVNFIKKNEKLRNIQKEKSLNTISSLDSEVQENIIPEIEVVNTFKRISVQIDSQLKLKPMTKMSMLPNYAQTDTDKVLDELELTLKNEGSDQENVENDVDMNVEQLKNFIVTLKNRIQMKVIAFDNIKEVIQSTYVFAFRFFLLKAALFDYIQLEKLLLYKDNPFNSVFWGEFKKKPVFAKIVNSVLKKQAQLIDLLDEYLPKARAVVKTSENDTKNSIQYAVNNDPYDDPTTVVTILLENLLNTHLLARSINTVNVEEKMLVIKFAILIKIILMIYSFGKFAQMDKGFEFHSIWEEVERTYDINVLIAKFKEITSFE